MTDIGEKRALVGDDEEEIISFEWNQSEESFQMKMQAAYITLGRDEAGALLFMAGDLYRAMTGNEPATFFAETPDD